MDRWVVVTVVTCFSKELLPFIPKVKERREEHGGGALLSFHDNVSSSTCCYC